jgi:hypothetical protein
MFKQSAAHKIPVLVCYDCGQTITNLHTGQAIVRADGQYDFLHWNCLCRLKKSGNITLTEWIAIEDWLGELLIVLNFNQTSWLLWECDKYRRGLK